MSSNDSVMYEMLKNAKKIAVVGLSDNPDRSSYSVSDYMSKYYKIIPVNPKIKEWNGITSYPSLDVVPDEVDIVNVFRRSEETPDIVRQAISKNAKGIWLQQGIANEESKKLANDANIPIVMDACIAVVHSQIRDKF